MKPANWGPELEDKIVGSKLEIVRTMASAMEFAGKVEVELDAVLATMANTSDDCEETIPATKLLLVERGSGLLRRQLTPKTKPEHLTRGG